MLRDQWTPSISVQGDTLLVHFRFSCIGSTRCVAHVATKGMKMKRMLINATQAEERRLAIVDGQKLLDFETEIEGREQRKGNIYKAIVTRIEPSLEACFVDYGEDRHGFLPFKEISRQYFREGINVREARIQDVLSHGQELLIQVDKEERGNKGAALTTFISLAGRYLVLMPNNPRGGGVSRRIEGEDREELKENLEQLKYPQGMSLIARTAGIGRSVAELQWDLNYMLKLWSAIDGAAKAGKGAFLIYQESSLVIRSIRDYFTTDVGEILIDTDDIFDQASQFMNHVMPESAYKVKRYRDDAPLFSRFQIEHQIETAFSRTVNLSSGGAIVIDHTEALVSVDVNSARSTRGSDVEETATRTNLEAADEIARQMRLRDLGGLIVVDFIDMDESRNRREVENRLRDALRPDRARVQFSSISKFGLLELSRQRLRPALSEGSHITCPRCNGTGHIRDTESSALQILRMVQEESMKDNTAAVHVQVPVEVTSFLLNEKRTEITKIELKQRVTVLLVPNKNLETPNYRLERLRHDDPRLENLQASYKMIDEPEEIVGITRRKDLIDKTQPKQQPIIKGLLPEMPAPAVPAKTMQPVTVAPAGSSRAGAGGGFFAWVKKLFAGSEAVTPATKSPSLPTSEPIAETSARSPREPHSIRSRRGDRGLRHGRSHPSPSDQNQTEHQESPSDPQGKFSGADEVTRRASQTSVTTESLGHGRAHGQRSRQERESRRTQEAKAPIESSEITASSVEDHAFADTQPNLDFQPSPGNNPSQSSGTRRRRRGRTARHPREVMGEGREEFASEQILEATPIASNPSDFIPSESLHQAREEISTQEPSLDAPQVLEPAGGRRRRGRGRDRFKKDQPPVEGLSSGLDTLSTESVPETRLQQPDESVLPSSTLEPAVIELATPTAQMEALEPLASALPKASTLAPFLLPTDSLSRLVAQAGLEWVQSDAEKIRQAQEAISQAPPSVRIPREPKPMIIEDSGPLVLVETRRDLSQIKLPFDVSESEQPRW